MNLDRSKKRNSHTLLEVCLRIIQELEEVRGFTCSETSYGRVILVGVVFAGKLSVVDFYFSLRRSEPKPQNRERMEHLRPTCSQKLGSLSHRFGSYWVGEGGLCGLGSCGGVFVVVMGGLLAFS